MLDGLRGDVPGAGRLRLLCGYAQCQANLGDSAGSNHALDAALKARDKVREPDSVGGIFEFSEAKQNYYAGSSLIWLDGGADAERRLDRFDAMLLGPRYAGSREASELHD